MSYALYMSMCVLVIRSRLWLKFSRFIRFTLFPSNGTSAACFISFGCVALVRCCCCCWWWCMLSCITKKRIWPTTKVCVCVCVCHCQNLRWLCIGFSLNSSTYWWPQPSTIVHNSNFTLSFQTKFFFYYRSQNVYHFSAEFRKQISFQLISLLLNDNWSVAGC